ncbi:MAG: hypothetical protein ABFS32_11600 [Bacteroidota bacterium]
MPKPRSDKLYALIKSMKSSEKRYFKLWVQADRGNSNPKFLQLFNQLDKQDDFDEEALENNAEYLTKGQLSNLKANLYTKILTSLKYYNISNSPDLQTRELVDYAQLLFDRSLYQQCDEILNKAMAMADKTGNLEMHLMLLKWKKKVISQTVGRDNIERANKIIEQVKDVNDRINNINTFTNLQLQLNSLYLKTGYIRNKEDFENVSDLFYSNLPELNEESLSLAEKSNLFSLHTDFNFFIQDFEAGYKYAKKWVSLFSNKSLIHSNLETYIKSLNSLMIAQSKIGKYNEFMRSKRKLRNLGRLPAIQINENISLKLFKYNYVHEFNGLFMKGDFSYGVHLFEKIKPRIEQDIARLGSHSRLIMYYKIASLYFGDANFSEALIWLNRIINTEQSVMREDIHGYSRMLSLICHYELGHADILDYHVRSTYRFLISRKVLQQYHKYILNFLKNLNANLLEPEMLEQFRKLRKQLMPLESNPYEKRAFIYFDIISWLEGKIQNRPVQEVIQEKAKKYLK